MLRPEHSGNFWPEVRPPSLNFENFLPTINEIFVKMLWQEKYPKDRWVQLVFRAFVSTELREGNNEMLPHWPKTWRTQKKNLPPAISVPDVCLLKKISRATFCYILMDRKQDRDSTEPTINSDRITEYLNVYNKTPQISTYKFKVQ